MSAGDAAAISVATGTLRVRAAFSTARFDLSAARGREPARANRISLARALGFDPVRAVVLDQEHGAQAVAVGPEGGGDAFATTLDPFVPADASVTACGEVALLALGADCPPVLLWHREGECVAAVHAGWRGLVAGVIGAAVDAMPCDAGAIRAAVGPRVGPCCYPVDQRLREDMSARFGAAAVRDDAVDLGAACVGALAGAGVAPSHVQVVDACTSCSGDRFFSHRRDGAAAGRQAGIIWIVDGA